MINYDMIVDLVAGMKEKHPRRRVETILREEGSDILRLPMGTSSNAIKGFLQKNNRCYITVVNSDLNENIQDKILFHELGHLVLKHAASSGNCLLADRSFSYRRDDSQIAHLENEANFFAAEYMLDTKKTLRTIHEYDLAADRDIVNKSGAWYAYTINGVDMKIGQGRENAKQYLDEHLDIRAEIEEAVRKKCGIAGTAEEGDAIYTEAVE